MANSNFIDNFTGITTKFIWHKNGQREEAPIFFKPYASGIEVFGRTTSIFTEPLVMGVCALGMVGLAGYSLLSAVGNVCTGDTEAAGENLIKSLVCMLGTIAALIAAILSPLINAIDLIGGGVSTVMECCADKSNTVVV